MNQPKKNWYTREGKTHNSRGKPPWVRKNNSNSGSPSTSANEPKEIINNDTNPTPYKAWYQYFPEEVYIEGSPTHKKIKSFENFIQRNITLFSFDKIEDNRSFTVDLLVLNKDETFNAEWTDFEEDLNSNGEVSLHCLGLAMHQTVISEIENQSVQKGHDLQLERIELPVIRARITNHQPILHLKNLKVNYFGKLVSVRGTVIRVSNVKLTCRFMAFECGGCGSSQVITQLDGVATMPTKCNSKGCRSQAKFIPLLSSPHTRTDNWQVLKLQELVGTDQCEGGRIPRTVECELTDDLVDSCVPGDDVTITGIIKVRNTEENNKSKQASIFLLYMDAVSVTNNKNQSQTANGTQGIEFNLVDYYAIQKIHAEPQLFRLLVHSLCPGIFGHELVKSGLLLGLFGGSGRSVGVRPDAHILVVGDPGLGKSQMLQACANVAPRGVFVCGNTSTSSGLTVTMTREAGGDYSLEAGALVLADQGCCCIDEFDKMPAQHAALLEAMEQQSVSIAKAGVVCTLPARTAILAAANPAGGHYNRAKTVSENLRIGAALLSRFDLVFILTDKPNQHLDSLLSEHVLALHNGGSKKRLNTNLQASYSLNTSTSDNEQLQDRLRLVQGEYLDVLPHQLLRKYIAYARKYVHPTLSVEAAAVLKQFYLELRKKHQTSDSTPVTTRQAQSLTRLTLARAKLEMREVATKEDALDVVELMKYSLVDTFSDGYDVLDFTRSQHGSGMSQRNKVKKFVGLLQRKAEIDSRNLFSITELKEIAQKHGLDDFYSLLNSLNIHGYLLKKDSSTYKLLSVD